MTGTGKRPGIPAPRAAIRGDQRMTGGMNGGIEPARLHYNSIF
jgi:hypothetical protein